MASAAAVATTAAVGAASVIGTAGVGAGSAGVGAGAAGAAVGAAGAVAAGASSAASVAILNPWIVGAVVARDVALVLGVAVYRFVALPPAQRTLRGYFSISDLPTHQITPNTISKVNTALQMGWLGAGLMSAAYGVPAVESGIVEWLGYGVLATTVWSGASYALKRGMKSHAPTPVTSTRTAKVSTTAAATATTTVVNPTAASTVKPTKPQPPL